MEVSVGLVNINFQWKRVSKDNYSQLSESLEARTLDQMN